MSGQRVVGLITAGFVGTLLVLAAIVVARPHTLLSVGEDQLASSLEHETGRQSSDCTRQARREWLYCAVGDASGTSGQFRLVTTSEACWKARKVEIERLSAGRDSYARLVKPSVGGQLVEGCVGFSDFLPGVGPFKEPRAHAGELNLRPR